MSPFNRLILILGILFIVAFIVGVYYSDALRKHNPFMDKHLLQRGLDKPTIWLYYDTSDVNSRQWLDFGARSSRALNMPFLNLCYESIVKHNHKDYRIEVIGGLTGVAELLGGWEHLPPGLRDPISPVKEAELNYIRAAILAKYGGLWLSPYCVCLKGFGELPANKSVFFGTDLDETYAGENGTAVPGLRAIWSPEPNHPMFKEWAAVAYTRVAQKRGGDQIRGDPKWDFVRFSTEYVHTGIVVDPHAEGMRKKNGKRLQLEDLLASGTDGDLPFDVHDYNVYIPFPWPELRDRRIFGWFLRMSESQIMNSDLAITYLLQRSFQS
uniref:Uncharacterized protein n=1 Tax=viral metagenome TaxID=1070528 RepID=A0A6C0KND7_9ZZZZ